MKTNIQIQDQDSGLKSRPEQVSASGDSAPFLPGFNIVKPFQFPSQPYEYKVTSLRECPTPAEMQECDTPDKVADYWRRHVTTHPYFNPEC